MFYTAHQLAYYSREWGTVARVGGGLIGLTLMLWGVKLIATRFGPRASGRLGRLNRNRVMLPREGLMYLLIMIVAFVASLIGRSNMLMLVFSIMAGPFILNGWVTFSLLKKNRVSRSAPPRAMAGEVVSVEVTLENRKRWFSTWLMVVRDRVSRKRRRGESGTSGEEVLEPAVLFASVRPGQSRTACYQLRLNRRGRYLFGPLETSTRFPLGLVERGYVSEAPDEMLIHPRIGVLSSRWYRESQMAAEMVQRQQTRKGLFDDEFHHLRDYRHGDSPRDIHWRTSARLNELMVRESHQSRDQGLVLVVDLWLPDRPGEADIDRVELAASFAATVCIDHLRQTRGVEQLLFVSGRDVSRLRCSAGNAGMEALLDTLAVAAGGSSSELAEVFQEATQSMSPLMRNIVLTTRTDRRELSGLLEKSEVPNLELFVAEREELSRWFSPETPGGTPLTLMPDSAQTPDPDGNGRPSSGSRATAGVTASGVAAS